MRTPAARCLRRAACFAYVRGARAQTYALLADPTIHFLSPAMMFLVVTVWSRKTTEETVTWFGVLNFGAKWLPWAMLLVSLMLNNNPSESDPAHSICAVSVVAFLSLSLSLPLFPALCGSARCAERWLVYLPGATT